MVSANQFSTHHIRSKNGRNHALPSHESSRPSSPTDSHHSIDSLDYRQLSHNDRLINSPSKLSDMSTRLRCRPWLYDRMVCEAITRVKSRKGSSIQDIAKNLEHKYSDALNLNNGTQKIITTVIKKLVKQGKLVKEGSNYRLNKKSRTRKVGQWKCLDSKRSDGFGNSLRRRSNYGSYGGRRSRSRRRRHRHHSSSSESSTRSRRRRRRSRSRSQSRRRRRSRSPSPSRSRSRSRRPRKRSRSRSCRRSRSYGRSSSRRRDAGGDDSSSGQKTLQQGYKRRKKGARKGQTRLSTGRRRPRQKKISRARRRVKHSYSRRPKSDKSTDGPDGSQNKGSTWFGGWFGGKGGDHKPDSKDKDEKSDKRPNAPGRSTGEGSGSGERKLGD